MATTSVARPLIQRSLYAVTPASFVSGGYRVRVTPDTWELSREGRGRPGIELPHTPAGLAGLARAQSTWIRRLGFGLGLRLVSSGEVPTGPVVRIPSRDRGVAGLNAVQDVAAAANRGGGWRFRACGMGMGTGPLTYDVFSRFLVAGIWGSGGDALSWAHDFLYHGDAVMMPGYVVSRARQLLGHARDVHAGAARLLGLARLSAEARRLVTWRMVQTYVSLVDESTGWHPRAYVLPNQRTQHASHGVLCLRALSGLGMEGVTPTAQQAMMYGALVASSNGLAQNAAAWSNDTVSLCRSLAHADRRGTDPVPDEVIEQAVALASTAYPERLSASAVELDLESPEALLHGWAARRARVGRDVG